MNLKYIKAQKDDADRLIEIYNASFYEDYIRYGECPAYGKTRDKMEESIKQFTKWIIFCDQIPVGAISYENKENGEYHLGCLCVIPQYQGRGIGKEAVEFLLKYLGDWKRVTLVTPADKEENIYFYTKKCGFSVDYKKMHGNVEVVYFILEP